MPILYQFEPIPMSRMKRNYYNLNIAQYAVFSFPEYNLNNFLVIQSEPKYQLAIYEILLSNIKAYSSAHLLNTVLEILSVTFDTTFTYYFFELETALYISPKIVQREKIYIKNFHMKMLNQHCPNVHIFVSQFRSCCSPNRNHLTDWFLLVSWLTTTTHKHWEEHDLILYFHFLLS